MHPFRFYILISLVISSILISGCASNEQSMPTLQPLESIQESYSLEWKVTEPIAYRTAMNNVEMKNASFGDMFESLFSSFGADDEAMDEIEEISSVFADVAVPEITSFISILEPVSGGNISVRMVVGDVKQSETQSDNDVVNDFNNAFGSMFAEGSVQLRGMLTPEGEIASFYLESRQRNLLAMFFELPADQVSVGDTWQLDFHCISMGQGFIGSNAKRTNLVRFTELSQTQDGRPLAILDYMMYESVDGKFKTPLTEEVIPTSMTCSYLGRGEFLIEEGQWHTMSGEMAVSSTGFMNTSGVQQLALVPMEMVPPEYIGLE